MEKKYYDLIISLIKEHRKYPGCEAILEDIANDVFEHSKVVINSITNEDVITAYLNKVISTSIVTVPKKLNFNTRTRHRVITTIVPQSTVVMQPEPSIIQPQPEIKFEEPSEPVVQEISILEPVKEPEELIISQDFEETEEVPEVVEEVATDVTEVLVLQAPEEELQEEFSVEPEFEEVELPEQSIETITVEAQIDEPEEETLQPAADVDKTLVDKMINGVSSNFEQEEVLEEELPEQNNTAEIYESLDDVEPMEEESEIAGVSIEEFLPEEGNSDLTLPEETAESFEQLEVLESAQEVEPIVELSVEQEEEITPLDEVEADDAALDEDFIQSEETIEELEEDNSAILDLDNNSPAFDIEEIAGNSELEELEPMEENEETTLLEEEDTLNIDSTEDTATETVFATPSYDCFSYEPTKPDYDYEAEEIKSYIDELNSKHPDRQISTICQLKYKQNLSVPQISEQLGLSEEDVLDVLNQIIDAIKD